MTRVMVTGASGTVGKRLVKDLVTADYMVIAISRNEKRLHALRALGDEKRLNLAACDLADTDATSSLAGKIAKVDALVHVAGNPPTNEYDHRPCTDQVIMSINLIAIFGDKIERAIIGSCTSVCGDQGKESIPTNIPTLPTTYHGSSLQAIEKLWNLYAADSGKPVTCIRFAPPMVRSVEGTEMGPGGERSTRLTKVSRIILETLGTDEGGLITLYPEVETR